MKYDCMKCGLCCCSLQDQDAFCDLTEVDLRKFSRQWITVNVQLSSLFEMLVQEQPQAAIKVKWSNTKRGPLKGADVLQCVALRGNVMNNVRCSIYENRPRVCRIAVNPGDRLCRNIRRSADDMMIFDQGLS